MRSEACPLTWNSIGHPGSCPSCHQDLAGGGGASIGDGRRKPSTADDPLHGNRASAAKPFQKYSPLPSMPIEHRSKGKKARLRPLTKKKRTAQLMQSCNHVVPATDRSTKEIHRKKLSENESIVYYQARMPESRRDSSCPNIPSKTYPQLHICLLLLGAVHLATIMVIVKVAMEFRGGSFLLHGQTTARYPDGCPRIRESCYFE